MDQQAFGKDSGKFSALKFRPRQRLRQLPDTVYVQGNMKCMTEVHDVSCTAVGKTSPTNRDVKTRQSHVTNHLQMVLDEFSKLTDNLSGSERFDRSLKLPYIAIGYFDEKGGSLSLDEYDVRLTIPRGAIRPGPPQQVYIYVDPTKPPNDWVRSPEVALSPVITCGPQGLRFEESVVLSFPHNVTMLSQRYKQLAVRMSHDDPTAEEWERFDGNATLVSKNKVILLACHFTNFGLVGTPSSTPSSGSSKRLKVGAFGGLLDLRRLQYAFRVHIWDDDKTAEQEVLQKENRLESNMLDDSRNMEFFWGLGNLAVKVSDIEGGWSARRATEKQAIHKEKIRVFSSNSVTFNLKRGPAKPSSTDDEELYCAVCCYQCSENEDLRKQTEVFLSICPMQPKQRSGENKSGNTCTCQQEAAASPSLCPYCKEHIRKGVLTKVHGEVDTQDYGGLPSETVFALCEHLDASRDGGHNWKKLVEDLTDLPGRSILVAEDSGNIGTKDLLKLYFEVCRNSNKTN